MTGLDVVYEGFVNGRYVYSVYAVSNNPSDVLLSAYRHTVVSGSMAGVGHDDTGGGSWNPAFTTQTGQAARDSFVTASGNVGSGAQTALDPAFGAGTGPVIPSLAGWYTTSPASPTAFGTQGRIKILQVSGAELTAYQATLKVAYKSSASSTTPIFSAVMSYSIAGELDSDGDGANDDIDCSPANAAIYPGAPELCATAGVDNDCDGNSSEIDANASDRVLFYRDQDGDTFTLSTGSLFCPGTTNAGFRSQQSSPLDCNDTNAAIYPGAPELCSTIGTDNDCDGDASEASGSVTFYRDADGDGYGNPAVTQQACDAPSGYVATAGDCNDTNAAIYPGAPELCATIGTDNDCDGNSSEFDSSAPDAIIFYRDVDGDGFGDSYDTTLSCQAPPGYVTVGGDGCPLNPFSVAPILWYRDQDNDGFGDPGVSVLACSQPAGYIPDNADCDDSSPLVNPLAQEICDPSNRDEDCDGLADDADASATGKATWYRDADGDGYGSASATQLACDAPTGHVAIGGDCNDTSTAIYPGAPELCATIGTDNDCDSDSSDIDANASDRVLFYRDQDGDSYTLSTGELFCPGTSNAGFRPQQSTPLDCDDTNAAVYPGATELCNGIDDDCNSAVDDNASAQTYYIDSDDDGYGSATGSSQTSCAPISGWVTNNLDCNDASAAIYPGAPELCATIGTDNNCNGSASDFDANAPDTRTFYSDADGDGIGDSNSTISACTAPPGYVAVGGDGCPSNPFATAPILWNRDQDNDSFGDPNTSQLSCSQPAGYIPESTDCDDSNPAVNPGAPEVCNGIDDNCAGGIDEGLQSRTYYLDADGDGYGDASTATQGCASPGAQWVTQGGDGCPSDPAKIAPGACGCGIAETDSDFDTVPDCIDNCPQAPNASQADCDGNGIGDACTGGPDCNGNGIPDGCDLASGQASDADGNGVPDACQADCNGNGIPDDLEISQGDAQDCDGNGAPDECGDGSLGGDTGNMGPVGAGQPATATLFGQAPSSTLVQIRVEVRGDLGDSSEFLSLTLNGVAVGGDIFRLDGVDCPQQPSAYRISLSSAQWSQVLAAAGVAGAVQVRLQASAPVSGAECSSGSSRVVVSYSGTGYDCDADGQPDSCQLDSGAEDCNGNGLLDVCEAGGPGDSDGDGTPDSCEREFGDFNLDNRIDGVDLAFLLAAWGQPNPAAGDFDGDGDVDGIDLSFLLARWGPVP